jgi:Glycosyltransferase family 87
MQAASPVPRVRPGGGAGSGVDGAPAGGVSARRSADVLRALGAAGLVAVVASSFLLAAAAAAHPTPYVPGRSGGWPGWLAGPLQGLGVGLGAGRYQALMLVMCAGYLVVLPAARSLPLRALIAAIVAAHLALLLGPPLISQDVFGYLGFARLGALHGLDPYTHVTAEAAGDPVFPFIGWPFKHSPYGPLFTLASYASAPLGLAGGLWAFKALAVASSLGAVALIARAAGRLGHSRRFAAAFVGLNPVLLALAVAGAHNDTLLLLLLAATLALSAGAAARPPAAAASLMAGVGIKVSAALLLPFLLLGTRGRRQRLQVAASAAVSLAVLAAIGLIGFGTHALGFLGAVGEQQQLVASHSVPAETARLVGLSVTPSWWRHLLLAVFVAVLVAALWRTARGADWRVAAGWTTLALLLSTAWLLPWYAIWALPLAAVSGDRRLRAATLLLCAYAVLIHLPLADPVLSPQRAPTRRSAVALRGPAVARRGPAVARRGRAVVLRGPAVARRGSGVGFHQRNGVDLARFQVPGHAQLDLGG